MFVCVDGQCSKFWILVLFSDTVVSKHGEKVSCSSKIISFSTSSAGSEYSDTYTKINREYNGPHRYHIASQRCHLEVIFWKYEEFGVRVARCWDRF